MLMGMSRENLADRITRPLRGAFIVLAVLSAPAFVFGHVAMLLAVAGSWPLWAVAGYAVSFVIVLMGFASLLDNRREKQNCQQDLQ